MQSNSRYGSLWGYLRSFWRSQRRIVARYFRVLSNSADAALDDATPNLALYWPNYVLLSAIVAVPVTALVRGAHMVTVSSSHTWLVVCGLLPGVGISIASLAALAWGARNAPRAAKPELALVVGLVTCALAAFVTIESAAGVTTALWYHGEVVSRAGAAPSLWSSEQYYMWHLLGPLPILELRESFGWSEPREFTSAVSGTLVIALKIVLLLPLTRVAVSGYWWLRTKAGSSVSSFDDAPWWGLVMLTLFATLLTCLCVVAVWSRDSILAHQLHAHLPASVEVRDRSIGLGWVEEAIQWAVLALMAWLCGLFAGVCLVAAVFVQFARVRSLAAVLSGVLLLLPAGVVLAAVATVLLARAGLAGDAVSRPDAPVRLGIESQLWGLAEAIPALDITGALRWERPYPLSGWPVGLVSVTFKLVTVLLLLTLPLLSARLARLIRVAPEPVTPVRSAQRFTLVLDSLRDELLRAERPGRGRDDEDDAALRHQCCRELLRELETCGERVAEAFGASPVSSAAGAAVAVAARRVDAVFGSARFMRAADSGTRLGDSATAFVAAATAAMEAAIPTDSAPSG